MMNWNQFDCINFQPLTFSFPPAPTGRPSDKVLQHERVEVVAYIDVLESQAIKYVRRGARLFLKLVITNFNFIIRLVDSFFNKLCAYLICFAL
jgi:hypothetical protein